MTQRHYCATPFRGERIMTLLSFQGCWTATLANPVSVDSRQPWMRLNDRPSVSTIAGRPEASEHRKTKHDLQNKCTFLQTADMLKLLTKEKGKSRQCAGSTDTNTHLRWSLRGIILRTPRLHFVVVGESYVIYLQAVRSKTERRDEADNYGVLAAS